MTWKICNVLIIVERTVLTYPNSKANPTGNIQENKLHPIVVFEAMAATEPNINIPPMHMQTKNVPLDAITTFDLRLIT
jgi:hypothetical protein